MMSNRKKSGSQIPDARIATQKAFNGMQSQNAQYIEQDSVFYYGKKLAEKALGISTYTGNGHCLWVCDSSRRLETVSKAVASYVNITPVLSSQFYRMF